MIASRRRWRAGWPSSTGVRPTRFAGSTARPTGCRAFTSTSTARPRASAATARAPARSTSTCPNGCTRRRRRPASRCGPSSSGGPARRRGRARRRDGPRSRWGAAPAGDLEVRENGLRFGVDLLRGQKGGLFLDQRDNRALVRTLASGRRVLNLFGYTGGFSIYAAAGGARATVTVDAAAPAIAAARRNFERNRLPTGDARFVSGDAFAFLEQRGARRRALRPGDLGPAQLRAQPPRARRGPARLPAAAPVVRGRDRARRDAVRGVVLEPRRPQGVPRHRARRRARRRAGGSSCTSSAAPAPTTRSSRNFPRAIT